MKKIYVPLLLLWLHAENSISQNIPYVANTIFSNAHLMPCSYNSADTIYGFDEWEIYQTLNNEWDGPIDSALCIGIDPGNGWLSIPLNQIDTSRRLFIVSRYNDSAATFAEPNFLYREEAQMNYPLLDINYSSTCSSQSCSYMFIQAEIPDSTGTSHVLRTYQFGLPMINPIQPGLLSQCYATEKFDTQNVRRVGMAIKFNSISASDAFKLTFFGINFVPPYCYNCLTTDTAIIANPNGPDWYYQFYDYFQANLLLYNGAGYPSEDNVDPVYVYPGTVALSTQQQITVEIPFNTMVAFQPFTTLMGSPVLGQPGVNHNLTVIDNGGNLCFSFIDVEFKSHSQFIYYSGEVELSTESACMIFDNGSELRVGKNATFNYGSENNMGLISFHDSATLTIERGATLNIYNRMLVWEQHPENGPKQFYTTLKPGATLRFMPGSHLATLYSVDNTIRLNVFMEGGILDDSGLPDDERALINRIYNADDLVPNCFTIFPNPAQDATQLLLHASQDETATVAIYDPSGKLLSEQKMMLRKGINELPCKMSNLSAGIYLMKVTYSDSGQSLAASLMKQ